MPAQLQNCNNINPDFLNTFPTPAAIATGAFGGTDPTSIAFQHAAAVGAQTDCYFDGEASLPVRKELASGAYLTSALGYGLTYNTLDNNKNPTGGLLVAFGQDFAGVGGDVSYARSTVDVRSYYEVVSDLVSVIHLQAGDLASLTGQDLRMLDHFKMGPNLVRGFQPNGIGPRDITVGTTNDALGGTMYWGASFEMQYPFYFLPKDSGFRGAVFVDAGSVWGYKGPTSYAATGEVNGVNLGTSPNTVVCPNCGMQYVDDTAVRASVGASLIWASPFGPLRFDFALPFLKQGYDRTQWFRFGGGTSF